ncbi:MAG TPA: hypothetical protein VI564_06755 [Candidatus Nanoarchaeia archaeon]|nr:hypothetical protein [Candidatus Nanoarchaeia archaeon]
MSLKERYESILLSIMNDSRLNGRHYLSYQRGNDPIVDVISPPETELKGGLAAFLRREFSKEGRITRYICEKIDKYDWPIIREKIIYQN